MLNINYILFFIITLILMLKPLRSIKEGFDSYDNCIAQGYPYDWCLKVPIEWENTDTICSCPDGQKVYNRYGRCYCQTYST